MFMIGLPQNFQRLNLRLTVNIIKLILVVQDKMFLILKKNIHLLFFIIIYLSIINLENYLVDIPSFNVWTLLMPCIPTLI